MLRTGLNRSVLRRLGAHSGNCKNVRFASERTPLLGEMEAGFFPRSDTWNTDTAQDARGVHTAIAYDYPWRHIVGNSITGAPFTFHADPGVGPRKRRTIPWDYQAHLSQKWTNDGRFYSHYFDPERDRGMMFAFLFFSMGFGPSWILASHLILDYGAPNIFGMWWVFLMILWIWQTGRERAARPGLMFSHAEIGGGHFPYWGSTDNDFGEIPLQWTPSEPDGDEFYGHAPQSLMPRWRWNMRGIPLPRKPSDD